MDRHLSSMLLVILLTCLSNSKTVAEDEPARTSQLTLVESRRIWD